MFVTMLIAAALGGPVRHLVKVDVSVAVPTAAEEPAPEVPTEPTRQRLDDVRITRWVPTDGDVPLMCTTRGEDGEFVEAHEGHRSILYLSGGELWLEYQPTAWPAAASDWPSFVCAFEANGKRVEWNVSWEARPAPEPEPADEGEE